MHKVFGYNEHEFLDYVAPFWCRWPIQCQSDFPGYGVSFGYKTLYWLQEIYVKKSFLCPERKTRDEPRRAETMAPCGDDGCRGAFFPAQSASSTCRFSTPGFATAATTYG